MGKVGTGKMQLPNIKISICRQRLSRWKESKSILRLVATIVVKWSQAWIQAVGLSVSPAGRNSDGRLLCLSQLPASHFSQDVRISRRVSPKISERNPNKSHRAKKSKTPGRNQKKYFQGGKGALAPQFLQRFVKRGRVF